MAYNALLALPPKRQAFVRAYAESGNGEKAAIEAGYAEKSAAVQASRMLTDDKVQAALRELQADTAMRSGITREFIVGELLNNHRLALEGNPVLDRYGKLTGKYIRNVSASNKALDQISELCGLKIDRKAVMTMDITDMSLDELKAAEAALEAELAKLEKGGSGTIQ